jgi:hypothetical protein
MDRYDIETVKQVLAKPTAADHFIQILIGGGNQSKIRTDHRKASIARLRPTMLLMV